MRSDTTWSSWARGNAALSAALAAGEQKASVLVVEKAPVHLRGGNSYFTGGLFRFAYDGLEDILELLPPMSEEERGSWTWAAIPSPPFTPTSCG